jgi:tetratricopeptide (TPR) repeat protein
MAIINTIKKGILFFSAITLFSCLFPLLSYSSPDNREKIFQENKYASVLSEYKALAIDELGSHSGAKASLRIGDCYFGLNEYDKAQKYYLRFIEKYADSQDIAYGEFFYAASLFKLEKYEESLSCFDKFLKKHPRHNLYPNAYQSLFLGWVSF